MKNYDQSAEINYSPNWPYIPNHLYRINVSMYIQLSEEFDCTYFSTPSVVVRKI